MKPRVELSPEVLRHHRLRRGLSFKQAGECLRKRPDQSLVSLANMYERIERTGVTSPERAGAIAAMLGVQPTMLNGEREAEDIGYEWWIESSSQTFHPRLLRGMAAVRRSIEALVEEELALAALQGLEIHAWIKRTSTELQLTYKFPAQFGLTPIWWSCRPAKRTESGISWLECTEHEAAALQEMARDVTYCTAEVVHESRRQIPKTGSQLAYLLTEVAVDGGEPRRVLAERFQSEARLIRRVVRKLMVSGSHGVYTTYSRTGVELWPLDGTHNFGISRWWRSNEKSPWHEGPWPIAAMGRLLAAIEGRLTVDVPGLHLYDLDLGSSTFKLRQTDRTGV